MPKCTRFLYRMHSFFCRVPIVTIFALVWYSHVLVPSFRWRVSSLYFSSETAFTISPPIYEQFSSFHANECAVDRRLCVVVAELQPLPSDHRNELNTSFLFTDVLCVCVKLWNTPTNLSANNVVIFINPVKLALLHIIFKRKKDTVQFTASVFCIVFIWKHCCGVWCVCVHVLWVETMYLTYIMWNIVWFWHNR